MVTYEFHPLANAFPQMSELEFKALKHDIEANGQKEPIVLFHGKILDGRNRYRACQELEIEPVVKTFKGSFDKARQLSTTANLMRRQLSKSQKAMFLVLGEFLKPRAAKGRRRKFGQGDQSPRELGRKFGVNHMTLYKAADIADRDTVLANEVLQGKLSVGAAEAKLNNRRTANETGRKRKVENSSILDRKKLPRRLVKVFESIEDIECMETAIRQAKRSLKAIAECGVMEASDVSEIRHSLNVVLTKTKRNKPRDVCSNCSGSGCNKCDEKGWLPAKK